MQEATSNRRLAVALACLGACGALSLLGLTLPLPPSVPQLPVRIAQTIQALFLVVVATWVGLRYAPRCGLEAPLLATLNLDALARARHGLRRAVVLGLVAGLVSWVTIVIAAPHLPPAFVSGAADYRPPWFVRVLYGGLTEEVLTRWGLMSFLLSLFMRTAGRQAEDSRPSQWTMRAAIFASALIFAAGHLPLTRQIAGGLTGSLAAYVLIANLAPGLAAGAAFARYGIEAAMVSHLATSVVLLLSERISLPQGSG